MFVVGGTKLSSQERNGIGGTKTGGQERTYYKLGRVAIRCSRETQVANRKVSAGRGLGGSALTLFSKH
jgi:hypothetical protein